MQNQHHLRNTSDIRSSLIKKSIDMKEILDISRQKSIRNKPSKSRYQQLMDFNLDEDINQLKNKLAKINTPAIVTPVSIINKLSAKFANMIQAEL